MHSIGFALFGLVVTSSARRGQISAGTITCARNCDSGSMIRDANAVLGLLSLKDATDDPVLLKERAHGLRLRDRGAWLVKMMANLLFQDQAKRIADNIRARFAFANFLGPDAYAKTLQSILLTLNPVTATRSRIANTHMSVLDELLVAARNASNTVEFSAANCGLLRLRLGLSEEQLSNIVVAYPPVLGYSYEGNIDPSLAALQARLQLSDEELRHIVLKKPQVLGYSYEANIKPSLSALQQRLGLSEQQLTRAIVRMPAILSYSFASKITPGLDKLQQRLDLDNDGLRELIVAYPAVLGYSFDANIAPKLDYLETAMGLSRVELTRHVQAMPALLGYSLEKRYRPRVALCQRHGQPLLLVIKRIAHSDSRFLSFIRAQDQDAREDVPPDEGDSTGTLSKLSD